ncbi:MAG: M48 family metalloprotease [Proteobacteria bacterium]|nr:M48 family metalloprotease [Pseudomonadota bacterium]
MGTRSHTNLGFSLRLPLIIFLILSLLFLAGCAEVTKPTPTAHQVEDAQLAATKRHPSQNWSGERTARVFLRLMPWLPQTQGRTYPFLGFNWWITATGKVAVDQVWRPSPAREAELKQGNVILKERGLKQGDIILAVNNWPIPTEVAAWDEAIKTTRDIFKDFLFILPIYSYEQRYKYRSVQKFIYMWFPGELLPAIMLDLKHINIEARGRYLTGPVELLIQRDDQKMLATIYPQLLPAEYAIRVDTKGNSVNAYAAPGEIILTRRMVSFCLNDDEMALIVGHEMAHHVLGHLIRGAAHRELGKFLGEAITAFSTLSLNHLMDWRHVMVSPNVRRAVGKAVVSVFSQEDEREADIYGAWYAFQAGYNIEKGLAVWERMAAVVHHDPFEDTYFLASHPAAMERLARLKLVGQYFKAGRAAEVFLQTADLNRRPPPPMPDALTALSPPPPPPALPGGGGSPRPVGSSHRERDGHPRPAGIAVYPDLSLVGGQEPAHHEQPQAGPVPGRGLLGGEEGLEDPE